MADVDDRWYHVDRATGDRLPSVRHGLGKRWLARWRDDGDPPKQHSKAFARKIEAERFLAKITQDLAHGSYLDPSAGKVTLADYAKLWLANQTFDPSTKERTDGRLRNEILPFLGERELRTLKPSHVQAWLRRLQQQKRAAGTIRVAHGNLHAILAAAVDDKLISTNPCATRSVRPPRIDRKRVVPWTGERLAAVLAALPEREQAAIITGAGLGLRQGELLGLAVEDIDFLRGEVHINRQVKYLGKRLVFAPPKGGKTRTVPLSESVKLALAEHLRKWPAAEVELPWLPIGKPETVTVRLVFTMRHGAAWMNTNYNRRIWQPALRKAEVPVERENGLHALRHYYASALLSEGVDIRALADFLGHTDPGFTLRVYAHLMPSSIDRARAAVDRALAACDPDVRQTGGSDNETAGQADF